MLEILIIIYALYTFYTITLSYLEINFIKKNMLKKAVVLNEDEYKNAAKISIKNQKFSIINSIYNAILVVFWSVWGVGFLQNLIAKDNTILQNTIFVVSFFIILGILQLPFSIYKTFSMDKKFGFTTTTPKIFIVDLIKSTTLSIIFGGLIIWLILLCFNWLGSNWWIYAFILSATIVLIINLIYPTIIAPIFNKVEPLKNEELGLAIDSLLTKCGFKSSGVFVLDASKRDKRLNAYFGGFGSTKRVVLFDTLLEKLSQNEIIAVLGHELGHFKHNDIFKNTILMFVILFIVFGVFGNIPDNLYEALRLNNGGGSFFVFLILYSPILTAFFEPLISSFSRSNEFSADEFSANTVDKNDMILALKKLSSENKAFPISHPIYSFVYHSHPSLYERINKLENFPSPT